MKRAAGRQSLFFGHFSGMCVIMEAMCFVTIQGLRGT